MAWGPPQPPTPDPECFPPAGDQSVSDHGRVPEMFMDVTGASALCGRLQQSPHERQQQTLPGGFLRCPV